MEVHQLLAINIGQGCTADAVRTIIYIIPRAPKREHASDSLLVVVFLNLTFGRVVVKRKTADVLSIARCRWCGVSVGTHIHRVRYYNNGNDIIIFYYRLFLL